MARPVIIDCDPGVDDAVALLLAFASVEELEVLGVTTVAGNVPLELAARNALILRELAKRPDVPVYAGCDRPLVCDRLTAEDVHGASGVDGMDIFEPRLPLESGHAVDFVIESLQAADDNSVTLVPTGPLTNIAMALVKAPDIRPKIREIVLMGGAMREGGNQSPSAEFNMRVDPHAANIVFRCGQPIAVFGLDVTHQVLASPERIERIRALGTPVARAVAGMLGFFNRHDRARYGSIGAPLHDPCTIAWLLAPSLFDLKACNIAVEADAKLTMGHTAVDFWGVTGRPANARWAHRVDVDGFYDLLTKRLGHYGEDA